MDESELEAIRRTLDALPRTAHWEVRGTEIDFAFDHSFRRPSECDLVVGLVPAAWHGLLIFGEMKVARGGGATPLIAVDERSGFVVGLDVERDDNDATYLMGSSPRQFVAVFSLLDSFLGSGKRVAKYTLDELRGIDEAAMAQGEWAGIVEYVNGDDPD